MKMFPKKCVHAPGNPCVPTDGHKKLSEGEFWKRYFGSKLFNSHRASIRGTASQYVIKADPIFDKYLEKPDDGMYTLSPSKVLLTTV